MCSCIYHSDNHKALTKSSIHQRISTLTENPEALAQLLQQWDTEHKALYKKIQKEWDGVKRKENSSDQGAADQPCLEEERKEAEEELKKEYTLILKEASTCIVESTLFESTLAVVLSSTSVDSLQAIHILESCGSEEYHAMCSFAQIPVQMPPTMRMLPMERQNLCMPCPY